MKNKIKIILLMLFIVPNLLNAYYLDKKLTIKEPKVKQRFDVLNIINLPLNKFEKKVKKFEVYINSTLPQKLQENIQLTKFYYKDIDKSFNYNIKINNKVINKNIIINNLKHIVCNNEFSLKILEKGIIYKYHIFINNKFSKKENEKIKMKNKLLDKKDKLIYNDKTLKFIINKKTCNNF